MYSPFLFDFTSQAVTLKETVGAVPQVIHKRSLCLLFHSPSGYKAKLLVLIIFYLCGQEVIWSGEVTL